MYLELRENRVHGSKEYPYSQYCIKNYKRPFQIPVHWHQEMEVIYVQRGILWVNISGKRYESRQGDICIVHPGELHYMGAEGGSVQYYTILFPLEFLSFQTMDGLEQNVMAPLRRGTLRFTPKLEQEESKKKIGILLEQLIQKNQEGSGFLQLATRRILLEMIEILCENGCLERPEHADNSVLQREMLTYIQQRYTEKLCLRDLSREFHMSEKYVSRYFKEHFGLTFKQYVQHLRLCKACELLEQTEESVLDISLAAGFPSIGHFIRVFKEQYQTTPLAYRKQKEKERFDTNSSCVIP